MYSHPVAHTHTVTVPVTRQSHCLTNITWTVKWYIQILFQDNIHTILHFTFIQQFSSSTVTLSDLQYIQSHHVLQYSISAGTLNNTHCHRQAVPAQYLPYRTFTVTMNKKKTLLFHQRINYRAGTAKGFKKMHCYLIICIPFLSVLCIVHSTCITQHSHIT